MLCDASKSLSLTVLDCARSIDYGGNLVRSLDHQCVAAIVHRLPVFKTQKEYEWFKRTLHWVSRAFANDRRWRSEWASRPDQFTQMLATRRPMFLAAGPAFSSGRTSQSKERLGSAAALAPRSKVFHSSVRRVGTSSSLRERCRATRTTSQQYVSVLSNMAYHTRKIGTVT